MANTVDKNKQGPIWPLGNIVVGTPGTPVNIMSLVDPTLANDPNTANVPGAPATGADEYAVRCYGILIQPMKAGASHGTQINAGNIYVIKRGTGAGTGNRDDLGVIIATLSQGAAATPVLPWAGLEAAPLNRNVFNPYDILIDADNAADGAQVTLLIQ